MLTPEQLIYDLQSQIIRLEKELEQAQKDIKDFEVLAQEWKRGYAKREMDLNIKLANANQTIEELESELMTLKSTDRG